MRSHLGMRKTDKQISERKKKDAISTEDAIRKGSQENFILSTDRKT
jgi:hypothetical protein